MKSKRGKAIFYLLILFLFLLIVLIIAGVLYIIFKDKYLCKQMNWNKEFCVDSFPDFPESIEGYTRQGYSKVNWELDCDDENGVEVCIKSNRVEYSNSDGTLQIHVLPTIVEKNKKVFIEGLLERLSGEVRDNVYSFKGTGKLISSKGLFWRTKKDFNFIMTKEYAYSIKDDGTLKNELVTDKPNLDNTVIKYFLEKYPSIKI